MLQRGTIACATFVCHLLLVVRIVDTDAPRAIGQKLFRWVDSGWVELLGDVELPPQLQISEPERKFLEHMEGMGKPLKTRSKFGPQYELSAFLGNIKCMTQTDRIVKQLRGKGVSGLRKLKVRHGSGGARKKAGGPKVGSVWACGRETLRQAYKHIALGSL